jgi:hypothetical protein
MLVDVTTSAVSTAFAARQWQRRARALGRAIQTHTLGAHRCSFPLACSTVGGELIPATTSKSNEAHQLLVKCHVAHVQALEAVHEMADASVAYWSQQAFAGSAD